MLGMEPITTKTDWTEGLLALVLLASCLVLCVLAGIIGGMKMKRSRNEVYFIEVLLTTTIIVAPLLLACSWVSWKDSDTTHAANLALAQQIVHYSPGEEYYEVLMPGDIKVTGLRRPFVPNYGTFLGIGALAGIVVGLAMLGVRSLTLRIIKNRYANSLTAAASP
jgi:hypothetical protein